jgi:non-ribosomal peptide synthetase component F
MKTHPYTPPNSPHGIAIEVLPKQKKSQNRNYRPVTRATTAAEADLYAETGDLRELLLTATTSVSEANLKLAAAQPRPSTRYSSNLTRRHPAQEEISKCAPHFAA